LRGWIALILSFVATMLVPSQAIAFEFLPGAEGFDANVFEGNQPAVQAGSHPTELSFDVDFEGTGSSGENGLKSLSLEMPPGLFENPTALAQTYCSTKEFTTPRSSSPWEASKSGESCADKTQVGMLTVRSSAGGAETRTFGLFNLVPKRGEPAELGASPFGRPIIFVPSIRQAEGEYGITLKATEIPQDLRASGLSVAIWGVPWSVVNNEQRGDCLNEVEPDFGWAKCSVGPP
jgi:hypothetical protein